MPKEATHLLAAEAMAAQLPTEAARDLLLSRHLHIFCFGALAPDAFYYDIRLPWEGAKTASRDWWGNAWAEKIHGREGDDTSGHLLLMLQSAREMWQAGQRERAERLFAFCCGNWTHVALDSVFHPLAYSVSGNYYDPDPKERARAECRHHVFEVCLDHFLLAERGETVTSYNTLKRCTLPPEHENELIRAFASAVFRAFYLRDEHNDNNNNNDDDDDDDDDESIACVEIPDLFAIAKRAFRKHKFAYTLIQSTIFYWLLRAGNWLSHGKLGFLSSACYAGFSSKSLDFAALASREFPHPVVGQPPIRANIHNLMERSVQRGVAFVEACYAVLIGSMSIATAKQILRPYSLNSGLIGVKTAEMTQGSVLEGLEE